MIKRSLLLLLVSFTFFGSRCRANEYAAELAAGGIQPRREPRISMNREKLTIALNKVTVEYEFLNESNTDITTEVAFPVPGYGVFDAQGTTPTWFEDFHVWVNDQPLDFEIEAEATLGNSDYTSLLKSMGVDLLTFAHFDPNEFKSDINQWPAEKRDRLVQLGLLDEKGAPRWDLTKTYHWNQRFPAHELVRIRHEYKPETGYQLLVPGKIAELKNDACIDPSLQLKLARSSEDVAGRAIWVKYILTTANTWKTPIKDFELVLERPGKEELYSQRPLTERHLYVSFCWDGSVRRVDANHFSARKSNFVPDKELTIYFLADY